MRPRVVAMQEEALIGLADRALSYQEQTRYSVQLVFDLRPLSQALLLCAPLLEVENLLAYATGGNCWDARFGRL